MANLANIGNFMATDPNWIQGIANMRGENPQDAMYKAQETSVRNAALEEAAAQRQTEAARRNALSQSGGQISEELISTMMQIDPEYGMKLLDTKRKQDQQTALMNMVGGGNMSDPSSLVAMGAAMNNPQIMALGTFAQTQQNRKEDVAAKEGENKVKEEKTTFTQEKGLRDEFTNISKPFITVRDAYKRTQRAAENPSAAADLSLIFNYMKMLDPGSTVREGEFASASNAGGVDDKIIAQYNKAINGERLSDSQRADFLAQSEGLYQSAHESHLNDVNSYTDIATQYGVKPERVVRDYGKGIEIKQKQKDDTQGYQEGQTATNPQTGERLILRGGEWQKM